MDMKKKLREFFTLKRHANDGFTLVELIVVIAIVAILGGVAVPAYSSYIEKADRAADAQLLADVNKAFAAACMVEGENNFGRTDVNVSVNTDGTLAYVAPFKDAFDSFYEGGAFKKTTELEYVPGEGRFVDPDAKGDGKTKTYNFGGLKITLNADDVAILSGDNAFSDRGSGALLKDVGTLETYLAGDFIGKEILADISKSDEFTDALGSYLGLKREDYADAEAFNDAIGAKLGDLNNPNAVNNALIMYSAGHAANATEGEIEKLFTYKENEGLTGRIEVTKKDAQGNTIRDNEATMANAALAYGMYTAYLHQNKLDVNDPANDFVRVVNTKNFADYVAGDKGQKDLEAYKSAMNMISDNSSNTEVTGSIMENGITANKDLADLMLEIMGK